MALGRHSFAAFALYNEQSDSMKGFLQKRWSFWLALFSCIAFLVGNMVGQHGWGAFWKSVWGKETEMHVVFEGAVSPLAQVPDPSRWSPVTNHTVDFSAVPKEMLVPLPEYRASPHCDADQSYDSGVLSVDYNGSYEVRGTGCGSHPAADILVPKGTPVLAAMNGIIDRVEERSWGFGNTVVIRHPDVPDPDRPDAKTTLYSVYAHLGAIAVSMGQVVQKGQQIAVSGQTGFATAPHLHFQIDRVSAPFHPYWPFTTTEATQAGYTFMDAVNHGLGKENAQRYTVNPLAYVQTYREAGGGIAIAERESGTEEIVIAGSQEAVPETKAVAVKKKSIKERVLSRIRSLFAASRDARRAARMARMQGNPDPRSAIALQGAAAVPVAPLPEAAVPAVVKEEVLDQNLQPLVVSSAAVPSTAETDIPIPSIGGAVSEITILHDGGFHDGWEEIVLYARDAKGQFVREVHFEGSIFFGTAFGTAEFSPSSITEEQFDERGRAIIRMLPRQSGHRAIVPVIAGAFSTRGEPLAFSPAEGKGNAAQTVQTDGSTTAAAVSE